MDGYLDRCNGAQCEMRQSCGERWEDLKDRPLGQVVRSYLQWAVPSELGSPGSTERYGE